VEDESLLRRQLAANLEQFGAAADAVDQQFTPDSSTNWVNWATGPLLGLVCGDGTLVCYESVPNPPPCAQFYRCTPVP